MSAHASSLSRLPSPARALVRRLVAAVGVVALTAAGLSVVQTVTAAAAHATAADGTAGYFVPLTGRALDTRSSGGQLAGGSWRTVNLPANTAVPTSGVSAVSVTFTALNEAGSGFLAALPNGAPQSVTTSQLNWNNSEIISNTAVVAVDASSKIEIQASVNTDLLIDVQGYFKTGSSPAPGGFVPNPNGGQRLVDTRSGLGASGAQGPGATLTVNAGGQAGIPSTATAVFANITIISHDSTSDFVTAYPTGTPRPQTSLNFVGGQVTALGSNIDLNGSGQFSIWVDNNPNLQPVDILVDVQGYYDGTANHGAFTPANGRLFDSRTLTARLAAGSLTKIPLAGGSTGVPAAASGVAAEAVNVTGISPTAGTAFALKMWGTSEAQPNTSVLNLGGGQVRGNLATVAPGTSDNSIWLSVTGTSGGSIDVTIDLEGWYSTPNNLPSASGPNCTGSGSQASAQQTTRSLTDRATMAWNPVNGNLQLSDSLLHLTGPGQGISVGLRYNALNDTRPTLSAGWSESALIVNPATGAVTYTAPDGACYVYTNPQPDPNISGQTDFTKPANWNATLIEQGSSTYVLRSNPSGIQNVYQNNGTIWQLTSSADQTGGNYLQYIYNGNLLQQIQMKDVSARSVSFAYNDPNNPTQPSSITETSLPHTRTVALTYNTDGTMATVTNAAGDALAFGYTGGLITSVTDNNTTGGGTGHTTTIAYDGSRHVSSWTLPAITGVSPTPAASTFTAYYDTTANGTNKGQTRLRDPNLNYLTYELTDQSSTGTGTTVTKITDMNGNSSSSQWSSHGDLKSRTNGLSNATTYNQGGNNLTNKITAPSASAGGAGASGQSTSLTFPTSTASDTMDQYRAGTATDAQGNVQTMQYGAWNQPTSTVVTSAGNSSSIAVAHQTSTFQGQPSTAVDCGAFNGEQCTSDLTTTDGATTEHTAYGYDSAGDLTSIARPSPLGAITMTYDGAGRMTSRTDGNNNTANYVYDDADRLIQVTYNTLTCTAGSPTCVTYTYDHAGNLTTRTDSTGTTTYSFDAQNRNTEKKTTKQTTTNGTTVTVTVADTAAGYDPAGNMTTYTDATTGSALTTTYAYDPGNRVVSLAEPGTASCPTLSGTPTTPTAGCTFFFYDQANNRTDTYLPNGRDNHIVYDTNNRITYQDNRDYGGGTTQANRDYAYNTGVMQTSGPNAGTNGAGGLVSATGTAPQNNGQNVYNTYYSYDGNNRLTDQGGAPNPTDTNATNYWHYDQFGNRTQNTTVGGATTYAAYNLANELCFTATTNNQCTLPPSTGVTNYSYDNAGNLTTATPSADLGQPTATTSYSVLDQMTGTAVGGTATNTYAYADTSSDERSTINSTKVTNGIVGLTYTVTGSGNTTQQTQYIRDPAGTLVAMRTNDNNAGWVDHYYTTDRLGSTLILTTSTGTIEATYTYDTWGNLTSPTPTAGTIAARNPYRYAAGYTDTTGLIKFGTRYYNPALADWTQIDPASAGTNYYAYAGDNPITNVDPTGRFGWKDFGNVLKGVGLAAGIASAFVGGPIGLALAGGSLLADLGGDKAKGASAKEYVGDALLDVGTFGLGRVAGSAAKAAGDGYEGFGKAVEHGVDGAASGTSAASYGRGLYDDYS